ncbi:MAG TPA: hypothetical protein VIL25_06580, partial [Vicinamibacterales bacterium]
MTAPLMRRAIRPDRGASAEEIAASTDSGDGRGRVRRVFSAPVLWLCGPALILLLTVFVWPLARIVGLSFQTEQGAVTLENYSRLLSDG